MSSRILLKRFIGDIFFILLLVGVSIKVCRILYKRLSPFVCGDNMIEMLENQGVSSVSFLCGVLL